MKTYMHHTSGNRDGFRLRTLVGDRPSEVPEGWVIFNAPRPLIGMVTWQAYISEGIFAAAVDPNNSLYDEYAKINLQNDACIVEFISQEEHKRRVLEWADELLKFEGYEPEEREQFPYWQLEMMWKLSHA